MVENRPRSGKVGFRGIDRWLINQLLAEYDVRKLQALGTKATGLARALLLLGDVRE